MAEFERLGGELEVREVDVDSLEQLAKTSDLVVVASGQGSRLRAYRWHGSSRMAMTMWSCSYLGWRTNWPRQNWCHVTA